VLRRHGGYQPLVGRLLSPLLSDHESDWRVRKSAIWWVCSRESAAREQVALRAAISPDLI